MNIAFLGIGSMGAAMVPHLVAAGHRVSVWNRNAAAANALAGVSVLASPAEAFANEAVFTMLSDDAAVRSVIVDSQALAQASAGCVHVMMATISIAMVEELEALHAKAGVAYVAAPVFGVPAAAAQAQLNIMVAGPADAVAKVTPVLQAMGQKIWPLGDDPKRAHIAKIGGNLLIGLAMEAMGEATALTESYGLKAGDFLNVITNTIFAAPSYKRYGGFIATDTYEPGFKLTLGLKDVKLALSAAEARGAHLPSAEIVRSNMEAAVDAGLGGKDWSIVAKIARRRGGLGDDVA
ncbi:MAG: NAD(P)-dependent oxidoreductase [Rhizobacter sp.]|nr:NAD(P)-dependent oxidoreductase [Rhizobacter sp.]